MSAMVAIAIYTPFAVISVVIFIVELLRGFKRHEDYLFTLLCLCIALWFASDIASLLTSNFALMRFLYNFKIIFVGGVPPVLLLFVLRFYKTSLGRHQREIIQAIFLIPILNVVVALSSAVHSWMIDIELVSLLPHRQVNVLWGPWFWVHTAQSYILSAAIIGVVIFRHFRMPRFYRMPSTLMAVGILLTLFGNVITLWHLLPAIIDPTLITCSLSMILFDLAIINNNKSRFVRFSHKRIYHYLDEYILILDETQRILEYNQPAQQWFSSRGITLKDATYQDVIDALITGQGATLEESGDGKPLSIYMLESDFPVVLELRNHKITDAQGDVIGSIAVFTDTTQVWTLIRNLEEKAGVDALTGIPNRSSYIGARARLDTPEFLPLSVIVCDVNDLKKVNDTLGHEYGDLMIKVVAQVLEQQCAADNFVARIGGDEFICMMPCTTTRQAQEMIGRIQQALSDLKEYPFSITMAMGVATKHEPAADLDNLVALADKEMYQHKRILKMH